MSRDSNIIIQKYITQTSIDATIVGYACIIDRSNGKSLIKDKIVSQIELNIPTFTENDLPEELSKIQSVNN